MKIKEHLESPALGVEDADNYIVINFASDSIKKDAKIIQATYIHKGEMTTRYVKGGNPKLNTEFTGISFNVYDKEALEAKDVEDDLVEFLHDEEIKYIVYNNVVWNKRLIVNNEWNRLGQMMNRIPCFAISDYEVVRRTLGDTLLDFGSDEEPMPFFQVCELINSRAKTAPRGSRCTIYTNYADRETTDEIPIHGTESVKLTFAMNKIMQSILDNGMNKETYRP